MNRNFFSGAINQTSPAGGKLRWFAVSVLLLGAIFCLTRVAPRRVQAERLPALQGQAAIDHLKQQHLYDSLQAAVGAARGFEINKVALADGTASTFTQSNKLTVSNGAATDNFGGAVVVNGNTAIIGAPSRNVGANANQGAAYVFVRTGAGWTQQALLTASDGATQDGFGGAVAVNGDIALVGATNRQIGANTGQGAVYVFTRTGTVWTQQQQLTGSDSTGGDFFGVAIALNNTTAVIGAGSDDLGASVDAGSAYVFTRTGNTWTQQQKLTIANSAPNDFFGSAVALSGESVLVGAPGKTGNRGAAYVFVRSGVNWSQQQQLNASDGTANDSLGSAVALNGETALVSAPGAAIGGNANQGAAYLFTRAGVAWNQQQKLTANDGAAQTLFGHSVALDNNMLAVGAKFAKVGLNAGQGVAYIFTTAGDVWTQSQKLAANDGAGNDQFGVAVAISGQTVISGAWVAKVGGNAGQGAAYIFEGSKAFPQEAQLLASDGATNDQFGTSVAISGDLAVIGASQDKIGANNLQGSAYVFARSNGAWTQQVHLIASDGATNDQFGTSVAVSGQTVVIGAFHDQVGANSDQGSAYVFAAVNHAWTQQAKLLANDGASPDNFGIAIAIDGDTVIVGAAYDDVGANFNQGSAYIYTRTGTTWTQQQKLTANNGAAQDLFGSAVAISGNSVVIGAIQNNPGNPIQGSVYVFTRSGANWTQQQNLTASDGAANDQFGTSVAISGNTLVASAYTANVGANTHQGAAYVFTRSGATWTQQQKLTASDGTPGALFGSGVALDLNTAVIGAHWSTVNGNSRQGAAYVFTRSGTTWTQTQKLLVDDGAADDNFGVSVGLSGMAAIAGAPGHNASQGAAYIFNNCLVLLTLTPATLPSGLIGGAYNQVLTAAGGTPAYSFTVSGGALPAGMQLGTNGQLSGPATASGMFNFTVKATDLDGCAGTQFYSLTINPCPVITISPTSLPGGTTGTAYSQSLTAADGATPYTFSVSSGALPTGIIMSNGALTGTPTASATFNFTVKATDANGCVGTQGYALNVVCPTITVNPASLPGGTTGAAYNQTITQTGGVGAITYSISVGQLPAGLTLTGAGALTGTLTQAGTANFTIKATDANGCFGTRQYSLVINCVSITVNPANLPGGTLSLPYAQTITSVGGIGAITFSTLGTPPPGLAINLTTGEFTGTPTQSGGFNFSIRATDANGCTGTRGYTLNINACAPISLTPASVPNGTAGTAYSQQVTASGGVAPYTYSLLGGALPNGLTLAATGLLAGTPTQNGGFGFSVKATDANGCFSAQGYTLTINCPIISVDPPIVPGGAIGVTYSQQMMATGGAAPYSFSVFNGTLPTGLALSSTGLISGLPTATGTQSFSVKATDVNGCEGARSYVMTINCPTMAVSPASLPNGTTGTAYNQQLTAADGTAPYSFNITAGSLPNGLTLSSAGLLSGPPTQTGSFNFTVTATDANGCTGTQAYTLVINNAASATLTVTGTGDTIAVDGVVTLREAITAVNSNAPSGDAPAGVPGLNTINFNIPGAGVQTIHLTSALPQIVEPVVIDGYTQPGASVNTLANGDNAVLKIELDGSGAANGRGLDLRSGASGSTIRGLAINGFSNNGRGIIVLNSNNNLLTGNFIGLDAAGATALGNTVGLQIEGCANNTVGGASPALRNVISGNVNFNIYLEADNGVTIEGNFIGADASGLLARSPNAVGLAIVGASNNLVHGNVIAGNLFGVRMSGPGGSNNQLTANRIGVSATGTPLGNTNGGVDVSDGSTAPTNNVIGGTAAGAGNVIANNGGAGVRISYNINLTGVTGHTVAGNSIYGNAGLGIDLQGNGVTPNDNGDGDSGANNQQNFPVLTSVSAVGALQGTLDSLPANTAYPVRIEFFANAACDASGNGEGEVYLGFITVNAPGNFTAQFAPVAGKPFITATATDANGNTSEFSACQSVVGCPAITINPANLPNGTAGSNYNQQLSAIGGAAPYSFAVAVGSNLPNGLTLSGNGLLAGAATVFGNFNFTVKVTDANGCTGTRAYALTINPPCAAITVNPSSLPNGTVGTAYSQTASAVGGTAPYTYTVSVASLPGGLNFASGGALTGTPNAGGVFSFTIKATDANGCFGTRVYTVTINGVVVNNGLQFYPLAHPVRLLDTRPGQAGCYTPNAQIPGSSSLNQMARGACDGLMIPANAMAVTGNITTVNSGGGYLTLYPSNAAQPLAATTNYLPNEAVNNVFTVGLGNDGAFKIFALNPTDVVVDVTGYYAPPAAGGLYFHPLPQPIRLLETRPGQSGCDTPGAAIQAGDAGTRTQAARINCGGLTIPNAALAIVGNATTVSPAGPGYLTLFPADANKPLVASSNYNANQVVNGPFTVGLSSSGEFNIYSHATTHLVVDVLGYYSTEASDVNGAGLLFNPLPKPVRLLETRAGQAGCYTPNAPLSGNTEYSQQARGTCSGETIPQTAQAIVGNATVVNSNGGYLTLWPSNAAKPLAAASNFNAGQVFNRHFTVGLGPDGAFKMYSLLTTDLVVDVSGFFAP